MWQRRWKVIWWKRLWRKNERMLTVLDETCGDGDVCDKDREVVDKKAGILYRLIWLETCLCWRKGECNAVKFSVSGGQLKTSLTKYDSVHKEYLRWAKLSADAVGHGLNQIMWLHCTNGQTIQWFKFSEFNFLWIPNYLVHKYLGLHGGRSV